MLDVGEVWMDQAEVPQGTLREVESAGVLGDVHNLSRGAGTQVDLEKKRAYDLKTVTSYSLDPMASFYQVMSRAVEDFQNLGSTGARHGTGISTGQVGHIPSQLGCRREGFELPELCMCIMDNGELNFYLRMSFRAALHKLAILPFVMAASLLIAPCRHSTLGETKADIIRVTLTGLSRCFVSAVSPLWAWSAFI